MITKINDCKIERQIIIDKFYKDYDNLIESKTKQIMIKRWNQKTNLKKES
jgi:hypothetical protein